MIEEIVNDDIEKKAKSVKRPEEAVEAVNNMKQIIKSNKCKIHIMACLPARPNISKIQNE